jgi:hypothetical protein
MEKELELQWENLIKKLNQELGGEDLDLQGLLFIIGLQELGASYRKLNKDQKLDVMHVAICTLLEPYGYYEFEGKDQEGWPHWKRSAKLPALNPSQQTSLMKEAIIQYFEKSDEIDL